MSPIIETLLWICVVVFGVTAVITILALIGAVKLGRTIKHHDKYLGGLYRALIFEIAAISVGGFGVFVKTQFDSTPGGSVKPSPPAEEAKAEKPEPQVSDEPDAPRSLDWTKRKLREYVESGTYDKDIGAAAAKARAWIESQPLIRARTQNLVAVFNLDETLVSNLPELRRVDFGYDPVRWDQWVTAGRLPGIEPVVQLFKALRQLGIPIYIVSGRREQFRAATEQNLRAIGCSDYAQLVLKSDDWKGTNASFKIGQRKKISADGMTIICNISSQLSDLEGGYAEKVFKLPNPFYTIE